MKIKFLLNILILVLSTNLMYSQEFKNTMFDSILEVGTYKNELRIHIDTSVIYEYRLVRIYENHKNEWVIEKYLSTGDNEEIIFHEIDELNDDVGTSKLTIENTKKIYSSNLGKEGYRNWLKLLSTKILKLPRFESIQYKLGESEVVYENGKYILHEEVILGVNDGDYYTIEIKSNDKFNLFSIDNPYFHINNFPEIDEFIYLNNFLTEIENIFNQNKI